MLKILTNVGFTKEIEKIVKGVRDGRCDQLGSEPSADDDVDRDQDDDGPADTGSDNEASDNEAADNEAASPS